MSLVVSRTDTFSVFISISRVSVGAGTADGFVRLVQLIDNGRMTGAPAAELVEHIYFDKGDRPGKSRL